MIPERDDFTRAAMVLQISADVLTAHLEGESVLLDMANRSYFRLNPTASEIWKELEAGKNRDEIIDILAARYDTSRETLSAGVDDTIDQLVCRKLLRETSGGGHP